MKIYIDFKLVTLDNSSLKIYYVSLNNTMIIIIGKISFLQVESNESPSYYVVKEVIVKTEEEKEQFISVSK